MVDNLVLNSLVLYHNGYETIEQVEIRLGVNSPNEGLSYLEGEVDDPLDQTKIALRCLFSVNMVISLTK